MNQPRLIIYDLDGTLVDSVPDIAVALDRALRRQGYSSVDSQAVRGWIGNGARKLIERAIASQGEVSEAKVESLLAAFLDEYSQALCEHSTIYPGVIECLETCAANGCAQAVITNKPADLAVGLLERLGLTRYFTGLLGGDSLPEKKPHPAPLEWMMREHGVTPPQTLMVGDSAADLDAARAAGVDSVAVTYGYNRLPADSDIAAELKKLGARRTFDSLADLPDYLERRMTA